MKRFLLLIPLLLVVVACGAAGTIAPTKPGKLRDTAFSIEPRMNGAAVLWLVHDDSAGYCITKPALIQRADWAIEPPDGKGDGIVLVRYSSRMVDGAYVGDSHLCSNTEISYSITSNTYDMLYVLDVIEYDRCGNKVQRDERGFKLEDSCI